MILLINSVVNVIGLISNDHLKLFIFSFVKSTGQNGQTCAQDL